jgi:hypothetical protein
MKAALLSLALLGGQLMTPAAARMPTLNIDALCKARSADDRLMKLPEAHSVPDCIRDETDAKQTLSSKAWADAERSIRGRCVSEIFELETRSYLDLLTCIQMAEGLKSQATDTSNTSKKRKTR